MNGNRFSVQPAGNILPGIQAMSQAKETRRRIDKEEKEASDFARAKQEAADAYQSGDPERVAQFSLQNPAFAGAMASMVGLRDQRQREKHGDLIYEAIKNPKKLSDLEKFRAVVLGAGEGDDKPTDNLVAAFQENPEAAKQQLIMDLAMFAPDKYEMYQKAMGLATGAGVAGIQEMEYLLAGLSDEDREKARRIKLGLDPRATESAVAAGEKAFIKESEKLKARYNLEPQVAGAVTAAKNEAAAKVKERGKEKSNDAAWDVYNSSMSNLAQAMRGTETGPIRGFIPAVTANAQIAEGAVAVMAPILKQMFRSAGEGTFTDKDQELLMGMVPTRKDLPEARDAKIKAIDQIVRAKLGITDEEQPAGDAPTITTQAEFDALPSGAIFIEDGVQYRKP
jgi:hypothetical protein